jgi:hypothetical protein
MAKYSYKTDGESGEFEADNDKEAIQIAKEEANLTAKQIADGGWLRVFDNDGAVIEEVA